MKLEGANSQQRFSSQSVSLASGTYSCDFYAQGTTQIGARSYALIDGSDLWGTGPTYTDLSGSWQKVNYTFTLDSDTEDFQFVFYTKADTAGKYVIVDDLVCTKN